MSGPNLSGLARSEDYLVGRGRVQICLLDSAGNPATGAWRDVGNCPAFGESIATEELEHRSSRAGLKTIDKTITISKDLSIQFATDELSFENLAEWLAGDRIKAPAITNPAIAGITEKVLYVPVVELGRWYDIQNSASVLVAGVRAYDIDAADLLLEKDGAPDVTLVLGTDYTLDLVWGRFMLLSTAVNIANGDGLNMTLTADAAASATVSEVRGLTHSDLEYAVKFFLVNAANGDVEEERLYKRVRLTSTGDSNLLAEEYAQLSFGGKCALSTAFDGINTPVVIRTHSAQ